MLCRLTRVQSRRGTLGRSADDQFEDLLKLCATSLEKDWLHHVRNHCYHLPDRAQCTVPGMYTRPDFGYSQHQALVYINGPHHQQREQQRLDETMTANLEDQGFVIIRFPKESNRWPAVFANFPDLFGKAQP